MSTHDACCELAFAQRRSSAMGQSGVAHRLAYWRTGGVLHHCPVPKLSYICTCTDVAIVSCQEGTEETLAIRMSRFHLLLLVTVRLLGQTLICRGVMLVQRVMLVLQTENNIIFHHTAPLLSHS